MRLCGPGECFAVLKLNNLFEALLTMAVVAIIAADLLQQILCFHCKGVPSKLD